VSFTESLHPRAPKGAGNGGQFAKESTSKTPAKAPAKTPAKSAPAKSAGSTAAGSSSEHPAGPSGTLSYNSKSNEGSGFGVKGGDPNVRLLQEALNKLGLRDGQGNKLQVDGQFGNHTRAAIFLAQKKLGLTMTGKVTPAFWRNLVAKAGLDKPATGHPTPHHPAHHSAHHAPSHHATPSHHHPAPKPKPKPKTQTKAPVSPGSGSAGAGRIYARSRHAGDEMTEVAEVQETPLTYQRTFDLDGIEIVSRAKGGDGRTVEAYAAAFGVRKEIRDQHGHYIEKINPTAFNRTINNGSAIRSQVLYNHGFDARGKSGGLQQVPIGKALEVRADGRGLLTVSRYNESEFAQAVLESIKNGDITAQSFEGPIFRSNPSRVPTRTATGLPVVERLELGLRTFGPTPTPYYAEAEITAVRSMDELAADFAALDEEQREELIRTLSTTPGWDPETATILATPHRGPGAEDSPNGHSMRLKMIRLKAELRARSL